MHTTQLSHGWKAIHNGDFSGDVTLINPDGFEMKIPADAFLEVASKHLLTKVIAKLEKI